METITKIAENNVEVSEIKETTEIQSYGQHRIDNERTQLNAEIERINSFDRLIELEKINLKIERLNNIEAELIPAIYIKI